MRISENRLAKILNCSIKTVQTYLARSTFSHIKSYKWRKLKMYYPVHVADITELKSLIHTRLRQKDKVYAKKQV